MKSSRECPKCGSRDLLKVARAVNSSKYNPASISSLAIGGTALAGAVLGLEPGALEARICRKCGFFELYVRDPGSIVTDGETVVEIDGWS